MHIQMCALPINWLSEEHLDSLETPTISSGGREKHLLHYIRIAK